jgi:hypothetical protein
MKAKVGLWIDHRKAIVVAVTDKREETGLVISAIEKQARRSQSSRHMGRYEPQQVPADDSRQKAFTGHLNIVKGQHIPHPGVKHIPHPRSCEPQTVEGLSTRARGGSSRTRPMGPLWISHTERRSLKCAAAAERGIVPGDVA